MDRHTSGADGNRFKGDDLGFYKTVPRQDEENGHSQPKNRKRSSKKFEDLEETPFTGSYKPAVQLQGTNPRREEPTCLENARHYFCNFCDSTSIHGFKFLGESERYVAERIWWFVIVCLAIYGSGSLIYKAYYQWVTSPVLVTFATTTTPIWKIPFPAVTICPEVNASPDIFNYTDVYMKYWLHEDTTEEEDEYFNLFSLVCNAVLDFVDENETVRITEDDLEKFLDAFADMDAENCLWQGTDLNCTASFSYILTSEGYCRTFNMLDPSEVYFEVRDIMENRTIENTKAQKWSLENGYPLTADLDTFPRRTLLAGVKAGLQLDLFVDNDHLDYVCGELQGFKVVFHHPAEEPNMEKYFRVPLDQAVIAGIKPRMITTPNELKAYSPQDRHCYFPGEKILSTFKIYTQQNCMTECQANYTLEVCGCLAFYMMSNEEFETIPICGAGSKPCVEKAKLNFLQQDVISSLNPEEGKIREQCNCMPSCTSLEFDSETSQDNWNWRKTFYIRDHDPDFNYTYDKDHFSRLTVYYQDMQFMTSERHELYGTVDFLANCGGLLGLFCGFSFTSMMEILYYLSLRLWCNLRKYGRRVWSGAPELLGAEEGSSHKDEIA